MLKENILAKNIAHVLVVIPFFTSFLNGEELINSCNGICIPAAECEDAKIAGFSDFCSYEPLIACCPQFQNSFGDSPSGLACTEYAYKYCVGIPLIANGTETQKGDFPYMANVGRRNEKIRGIEFDCGGTIIHEKYVLTAAHCINQNNDEEMFVRLGGYNRTDGVIIEVKKYTIHPNARTRYNDIALLELKYAAKFDNFTRPACLPTTSGHEINMFTATGWGYAYDVNGSEMKPPVLMAINLTQVDEGCSDIILNVSNTLNICTRKPENDGDVCRGDSGGPVATQHPKCCLGQVFGVVGGGGFCAAKNSKTAHARVFSYLQWIENIVWPK